MDSSNRTEEADKVSARIAQLLSEKAFSFIPNEYISIHKKLFSGIYDHAGKIRDYNISKREWVLDGVSVYYCSASELRATLEYDFSEERHFNYKNLSMDAIIQHLAMFVSRLWQIHIFGEGNTRTTAVFFIKYLRSLGFDASNDIFAENAWFFRNSLVRANYNDLKNGVHATTEYLKMFLRNLLLGEDNNLSNRSMHISGAFSELSEDSLEYAKTDIGSKKADIETKIADIAFIGPKTKTHILALYEASFSCDFFGRSFIENSTGLKKTRASEIIQILSEHDIIEPVKGHGKGKYRFKE